MDQADVQADSLLPRHRSAASAVVVGVRLRRLLLLLIVACVFSCLATPAIAVPGTHSVQVDASVNGDCFVGFSTNLPCSLATASNLLPQFPFNVADSQSSLSGTAGACANEAGGCGSGPPQLCTSAAPACPGWGSASVNESAGILRGAARMDLFAQQTSGVPILARLNAASDAFVLDTFTLSRDATVHLVGSYDGFITVSSNAAFVGNASARVLFNITLTQNDVASTIINDDSLRRTASSTDQTLSASASKTFDVPLDLAAGAPITFSASLEISHRIQCDVPMAPNVCGATTLSNISDTATFRLVVPDDVIVTSASGLLPVSTESPATVPEPTTLLFVASGILALSATGFGDRAKGTYGTQP